MIAFGRRFDTINAMLEAAQRRGLRSFRTTDAEGRVWVWTQREDGAWSAEHESHPAPH